MADTFSKFNPAVNFVYFTLVIIFAMCFMHPCFLALSLVCSFSYSLWLKGRRAIRFNLLLVLPLMLIMAVMNPLFNHSGETVLFYLASGQPITMEAVLYGAAAAAMAAAVVLWFSCFNVVMTQDKILYLFAGRMPSISLLLSMIFRFIPLFSQRLRQVTAARRAAGGSAGRLKALLAVTGRSLENAVETADSMRARGYGLKGRSAASVYTFALRDLAAMGLLISAGAGVIFAAIKGAAGCAYFPSLAFERSAWTAGALACYGLLALAPAAIDIIYDIKWRLQRGGGQNEKC